MKQKLLVDTDILIDVSRGITIAINRLQSEAINSTLAISTITQMELIVGCRNKIELQNLEKFLQRYLIIKVNEFIADKAIELLKKYRLSNGLLIPDGLIAATAIVINAPLLSKNQRDYRFISELNLLSYP
ncbi:MAG: type II toxin-antitoxin system VapC family toxin [Xenococcaceae cyanobacterium MO_188.B32]|nr:type II toxin-antitoxin system VapC family toxin [Xenococcaceae cyanobacterium MO_188.B32]